uniref:Uncharacterized protein n=1 Tax=Glossina austeni TaxID=7395 RepID=A0A1A9VLV1_GLOAU
MVSPELLVFIASNNIEEVELILPRINFESISSRSLTIGNCNNFNEFEIKTGIVPMPEETSNVIVLAVIKPKISRIIQLKNRASVKLDIPIAVHCSKPINKDKQQISAVVEEAEQN